MECKNHTDDHVYHHQEFVHVLSLGLCLCEHTVCILTISNKSHISVLLTEYFSGGKIEKNEMGEACGAYGAGKRGVQGSGGET